jgi:hypothetical protein
VEGSIDLAELVAEAGLALASGVSDASGLGGELFRCAVIGESGAEGGDGLAGPLAGGAGQAEDGAAVQLAVGLRLAGFEARLGARIGGEARCRLCGIGVDTRGHVL